MHEIGGQGILDFSAVYVTHAFLSNFNKLI